MKTIVVEPQVPIFSEKAAAAPQPKPQPATRFSWEQGPMQLIWTPISQTDATDQYTKVASEMALVHNCIIRALNSIYIQAPHVPASQYPNFISYSLSVYQGLTMHHDGEEETFFPLIEELTGEKGLMDANVQGHRDFDTNFNAWGKWLEECSSPTTKTTFSPTTCIAMMDAFISPLSDHLAAEIPTLLALSRFEDKKLDLLAIMDEEGKKVMGGMSKTTQLPMFLLNHDTTFEGGIHNFPPVPAPVKFVLREVCGRWQSAWWQFSTVGFDGFPREVKYRG